MSAEISTKTKSIGSFLRAASKNIIAGTGEYISSAMPTTSSTISGAREALRELSAVPTTVSSIASKANELRRQSIFKKLSSWFVDEENEYDESYGAGLSFDLPEDDEPSTSSLVETEISEWNKNANQISKSVVESSHKLFEAQISATANTISAIDKQTAIISSGFDKTHNLLESILNTLTKNTATMIETIVATADEGRRNSEKRSPIPFDSDGKFNFANYKDMIMSNAMNTNAGIQFQQAKLLASLTKQMDAQGRISAGMSFLADTFVPNLEKNMKAFDDTLRDVITDSLIRLGENKSAGGLKGFLSQIFGIEAGRTGASTARSQLELKTVSFDSVTRESIIGAIPGYLRHILTAVGGPDLIYDFKSRSFKSQNSIRQNFHEEAIAGRIGMLSSANGAIQNTLNKNAMSPMLYDMMMNDLGKKSSSGEARKILASLDDEKAAEDYVLKTLLGRTRLTSQDRMQAKEFAKALSSTHHSPERQSMLSQANRANLARNNQINQVLQEADLFGADLSFMGDIENFDKDAILEAYGRRSPKKKSSIRTNDPKARLSGVNYTNMALYEIYRRLNEGINVFQVGKGKFRSTPFERFADDVLQKPYNHKPKQVKGTNSTAAIGGSKIYHDDGSANLLENQQNEDGSMENLGVGERITRWGKLRGGNLAKAMFSGNPEQVKEAFGLVIRDLTDTSRIYIKKGLNRINDSFGNVTGFLKHKLFGSAYSYDSGKTDQDGNPIMINIKQNSAGGLFGFVTSNLKDMFKGTKDRAFKWFKDVAGYFNYGKKGSSDGVEDKRKKFLVSSIGAYAGAGILGGPVGMLVGAIGANALDAAGIGDKLKGFLFGKDVMDKNGKLKHQRGIITRVVDGVIDPFRYQLGKTFRTFSKTMKKKILGPLSDLGFALKERITSTVANVAKSRFGKVFSFIGKMLLAPFKGAIDLAKFPIHMLGAITRGTMGAAGSSFSGVTGALSYMLAGSTKYDKDGNIIGGRGALKQRREQRNKEIEEEYKDDPYASGFSAWRQKKNEGRSKVEELKDALAEAQAEDTAAISESNKNIEESSKKTADAIENMNKLASEKGSLYTHDDGLHKRIDAILSHLGINVPGTNRVLSKALHGDAKNKTDNQHGFTDSLVGATATLVSGDETVSNEESRLASNLIDEGGKDRPNSSSMISKIKNILRMQSKRREEKGEKKGIFDTIADFVKDKIGIIGPLLAGAAAAFIAFSKDAQNAIGNVIGKLGEGFSNFFDWLKNGDENGNSSTGGITNLLTSPFDIRTESPLGLISPYFAGVYHVKKDAAGNDIENVAAANSRSALYREWGTQSYLRSLMRDGHAADMRYHMDQAIKLDQRAQAFQKNGQSFDERLARVQSNKALDRAAYFEERLNRVNKPGWSERITLGAQGGIAGVLGGGAIGGMVGGKLTRTALDAVGIKGPMADVGERVGEAAGTIKGMTTATKIGARIAMGEDPTKYKIVNTFISKMKEYLIEVGKRIANTSLFKGVATPVINMFASIMDKITVKMLLPMAARLSAALAKVGINVTTGVATAGVASAAIAIGGGIMQFFQTENLFGVPPDKADVKMRLIAGAMGTAFNLPYAPLLEVFDPLFPTLTGGEVPSLRSWVAVNLYRAIASDEDVNEFEQNRGELQEAVKKYNEKYGVKLDTATYNDMINPSTIGKLWKGTVLTDENGDIEFTKDGAVRRSGGLQSILLDMLGKEVKKDENGNTIIGSDGLEEREDFDPVKIILTPVMWPFRLISSVKDSVLKWIEKDSPWAKEGQTLPFWAGEQAARIVTTPLFAIYDAGTAAIDWYQKDSPWGKEGKSLTEYVTSNISAIPGRVKTFFVESADSVSKWYNEDSPWGQEGMGVGEYAVSKIRSIPEKLGEFYNEAKTSVENWFKSESPWEKEGKSIGEWILDKIAYPFKILKEKTEEFINKIKDISLKDLILKGISSVGDYFKDSSIGQAYQGFKSYVSDEIDKRKNKSDKNGAGGGLDEFSRGTGMSPLSQDAVITSDFGMREHPVFGGMSSHRGIDIAPKNGSSADALATFPGKITDIGFQEGGAGNYVTYQADNGLTVKYMHLADNSIPSGMKRGSRVAPGAKIGGMGSTGASTGPHLHYQLEQNGVPIDPSQYMDGTIHIPNARLAGSDINGDDILNEGTKWLGTPYVLGAADDATDATDCGKFTRDVCTKLGIDVNSRLADVQYEMFENAGAAIDVKDLQPGDFVFFENTYGNYPPGDITHVGFYAGNGYALHAGSSKGVSFVPLDAMNYGQRGGSIQKLWKIAPGKGVDANMQVGAGTGGRYNGSGGSAGKIGGGGGKKASGPLGQLLDSLKGAGSMFLNNVSGGLFGSEENNGSSSNGSGGSSSGGAPAAVTGENAKDIWNYLTGPAGYGKEDAAAIMGNMEAESGLNPRTLQGGGESDQVPVDGETGYGLAQWTYITRQQNLANYASQKGKPGGDLGVQLEFFDKEAKESYGAAIDHMKAAGSLDAKTETWMDEYENPDRSVAHLDRRQNSAAQYLAQFGGAGGPLKDPVSALIDMSGSVGGSMAPGKSVVSNHNRRNRNKKDGKGGGLDEIFSSIGKSVNKGARKLANSALDQFFGTPNEETSRYYVNVNSGSPNAGEVTEGVVGQGLSGNTERVEALLSQVIAELQAINGNTSTSSSLLNSINQKDFVDHGVRESIKALGESSKNRSKPIPSRGNTRAIQNIIRP